MQLEHVVRLALWPAALAAGGVTAALILTSDTAHSPALTAGLTLLVGLSWCVTGLLEWGRRPANRIGLLMVIFGFAWFGGRLTFTFEAKGRGTTRFTLLHCTFTTCQGNTSSRPPATTGPSATPSAGAGPSQAPERITYTVTVD